MTPIRDILIRKIKKTRLQKLYYYYYYLVSGHFTINFITQRFIINKISILGGIQKIYMQRQNNAIVLGHGANGIT
jgi:hypothetical protein